MNRYILIRRLKGPAILLLIGTLALLHQADLASWKLFLPLLLILIGGLKLAERAALAAASDEPPYPGSYPGAYPSGPYPYGAAQAPAQPGAAIVPSSTRDSGKGPLGGQS